MCKERSLQTIGQGKEESEKRGADLWNSRESQAPVVCVLTACPWYLSYILITVQERV